MDLLTFSAVLGAAVLHAGWNAVVKVGLDRFSSILLLGLFQSAIALALVPFFPFPAAAAWNWLVSTRRRVIASNVSGVTKRRALRVSTATTSWPCLCRPRATSTAL